MFVPDEADRLAALFANTYLRYQEFLDRFHRVPASLEVIFEEARRQERNAVGLMYEKMSRLEP